MRNLERCGDGSRSPESADRRRLRALSQFDADVIIPGHGPAWRDRDFLNLEASLLESVVGQVNQAAQKGVKFTHDGKDLNEKFHRFVNRMIENASAEARDRRKFEN